MKIKILTVAAMIVAFACAGVAMAQQDSPTPTPTPTPAQPKIGFRQQDFEPSPLDPLSKLVLSNEAELKTEQEPCTLGIEKAPAIRGIRLGMTLVKFKTLFPRSREVRNRSEVGESIWRDINVGNARLNGVTDLGLYFLDGKLYFFVINYSSQIQWESLDQFVEQFSKGVGLQTQWGGSTKTRILLCHGFGVLAEIKDGHPQIVIEDRAAAAKLTKREERSKSPASFRP